MMQSSQPLAELHDIVAAPPAHWWPLAPAWYLVALLLFAVLIIVVRASWRWSQRRRIRNAALKVLQRPLTDLNAITLLLKQACLGYFSAAHIAPLTGPAWFSFLTQQLPANTPQHYRDGFSQLTEQAYQQPDDRNCEQYQQLARYWLRHALPPRGSRYD